MSTPAFKVDALISAAHHAIELHDKAVADYDDRVRACQASHLHKWQQRDRSRLKMARNALTTLLRSEAPITRESYTAAAANGHSGVSDLFYREPDKYVLEREAGKPGYGYHLNVEHYRGLIAMLSAYVEPTITAAQLQRLGYSKLTTLFEAAARNGLDLGVAA